MKIIYEIFKNFTIIFRNISSIALLILGPLVLILLIGFAFSSDTIHGITIGIKADNMQALEPILQNFTAIGRIQQYHDITTCLTDMQLEQTHICLEFSENFLVQDQHIPTGQIVFYFDNTRKKISNAIVTEITEVMGIESEKISIESAKTIFKNIESLVVFLDQRNSDIEILINESKNIRQDLTARHDRLVLFREEFLPKYYGIKKIQNTSTQIFNNFNEIYTEYTIALDVFETTLQLLEHELIIFSDELPDLVMYPINKTFYLVVNETLAPELQNISQRFLPDEMLIINQTILYSNYYNSTIEISLAPNDYRSLLVFSLRQHIKNTRELLNTTGGLSSQFYGESEKMIHEFDQTILLLDDFKKLLDEDIAATQVYIAKIDISVMKTVELQESLNQNIIELSKLNPELAERLVKPIVQSFEPLSLGLKDIKIAFPTLLSLVIVFISILFANIVTLSERSSSAFYRNLIAPVNDVIYTMGLILTNAIVVIFQVFVLLLVAEFKFHMNIFANIIPILTFCVLLSAIFIFLGMIYAFLFDNEQTSILVTTFSAIALFMFSNILAPLESMPVLGSIVAGLNPFVMSQSVFKKIMLFDVGFNYLQYELGIFLLYFLMGAILLMLISKYKNRKYV